MPSQHLFEQLDVDEDGAVTQGDLEVCLLDWERLFTTDRWEMYVDRAFDHLDANRNGTVSLEVYVMTRSARLINRASPVGSRWPWRRRSNAFDRSHLPRRAT